MAFKNSAGGCGIAGETLNPTQDSYVDQGGPTTTFGTASTIRVRSRAGQNRRALVQFSLPAVPAGCSLVGASLRLWDETPYSGRVIEVHRNSAAWTEAAVNWNNQPGVTGTAVTATSPGDSAWMQWDVTDHVEAMYSGTNDGFGLRDQTEDGPNREQQFNSLDDGSDAPQLVLQFG
jgi:hypothetical protein